MSKSFDVVKASLRDATVDAEIQCALDPSYDMRLPTEYVHWAPAEYSRIFRAYSAACLILNEGPDVGLIDSPVEIPKQSSWLGVELLKLLNGTVTRDSKAPHKFEARAHAKDTVCINTEEFFMKSLGHDDGEITRQKRDQTIYTNDSDVPVLFAKGDGDVKSSISFTDIDVEGITFPAGTVFRVRKKRKFKHSVVKPGLLRADLDSIASLQPLRLSLFAIPHDERLEATVDKPLPELIKRDRQTFLDSLPTVPALDKYLRAELENHQTELDISPATSAVLASSR
jgi:hypothetical protein